MTKQEYIEYWKQSATRDWRTVEKMFVAKEFIPALFFSHLVLEKLLKAHWVKDNEGDHPPKIHNLVYLLSKTKLVAKELDIAFLEQLNSFQIEGRYPDYQLDLYRIYKAKQTEEILNQVNKIRKWLLKAL